MADETVDRQLTGSEALGLAALVVHRAGGNVNSWLAVCKSAWERVEAEQARPAAGTVPTLALEEVPSDLASGYSSADPSGITQ